MNVFNMADQKGQDKVMSILDNLFSACTCNYEQFYTSTSPIDILMTATTRCDKQHLYAIECKDREYTHTYFKDGWVIEEWKYNRLLDAKAKGYRPLLICTFSDNTYVIWDISTSPCNKGRFFANRTTMEESPVVEKYGRYFKVEDALKVGYLS